MTSWRARAGGAVAVVTACLAGLVMFTLPASAAVNDGVLYYDDGTPVGQSVEDYCQEFYDDLGTSGGCDVDYEETSGFFHTLAPERVSRDGTTCPGASVNRVTVTETKTFSRTLGFSVGLGEDRKFGEKGGNTIKLAGAFNYSQATSEGSSVGYSGSVDQGNIGFIEFAPKYWYSVGQMRYTDQYGDTVSTEVDGDTPAKVGEFADGVYSLSQRPMTADELATFC